VILETLSLEVFKKPSRSAKEGEDAWEHERKRRLVEAQRGSDQGRGHKV